MDMLEKWKIIDYSNLKKLFNKKEWDMAYVSPDHFKAGGQTPIKCKYHLTGYDLLEEDNPVIRNGIILAKYSELSNDYSLYDESLDILQSNFPEGSFIQTYVNFKEVSLLSGFGHRAKNSLIYNRKFGFQCKFITYMFMPEIVNYEKLESSTQLLDLCDGCSDCIKNCPVNAIHEDWIDGMKCDLFIGTGNHPTIPSIKWFWYEKMRPDIPREVVESWDSRDDRDKMKWGRGVDGYYEWGRFGLEKDGVPTPIPHCRECQKQPRCSKAPVSVI